MAATPHVFPLGEILFMLFVCVYCVGYFIVKMFSCYMSLFGSFICYCKASIFVLIIIRSGILIYHFSFSSLVIYYL